MVWAAGIWLRSLALAACGAVSWLFIPGWSFICCILLIGTGSSRVCLLTDLYRLGKRKLSVTGSRCEVGDCQHLEQGHSHHSRSQVGTVSVCCSYSSHPLNSQSTSLPFPPNHVSFFSPIKISLCSPDIHGYVSFCVVCLSWATHTLSQQITVVSSSSLGLELHIQLLVLCWNLV